MQKVALANTGESVSQFCLGTMLMGSTIDQTTSYQMLDYFVDRGGDFIDTANCYAWWMGKGEFVGDESEMLLGQWMKERGNRDKIFLATKVGARIDNPQALRDAHGNVYWDRVLQAYQGLAAPTIRQNVEGSLRRLQTDVIDLYYAHIDDRSIPLEETLGALNDLVQAGKVRYIACSNLHTWRLERALNISAAHGWAAYVAAQQEYSYLRPKAGANLGISVHIDDEMLDYFRSNNNVALVAYSPLLKGIYDDAEKRANYYNWPLYNTDDSRVRLEVLSSMAQELGVSNSQLVLAWMLHHDPRVIPIVAASRMEQFEHNLGALTIHLTTDQMTRLNDASV